MAAEYSVPSHCETAVIFDLGLMFVFEPLVVPFYYVAYKTDAEDFFVKHCVDCSLRGRSCTLTGAINRNCSLGFYVQNETITKSMAMPIPKHVLVLDSRYENPLFGYETNDCIRPLRLGNIGSGGSWCNGNVVFDKRDVRSVYSGYMGSIHNADLTNESSDTYEAYLEIVALDFTKINTGYPIELEDLGTIVDIVQKPTSILWDSSAREGYYKQGRNYVKIQ